MEKYTAVVIGASGGIGSALVERLRDRRDIGAVVALSRSGDVEHGLNVFPFSIDVTDEASVQEAAAFAKETAERGGDIRLIIVASGILSGANGEQPEKDWRQLDAAWLSQVMAINAVGPAIVAKHFLPLLPNEGRSVFAALSARVGSIADNKLGGWYGYRASKAALNMLIKSLSIELARKRPGASIIGLHPGTVDTALSKPFQGNVPGERLFTPEFAAEYLLKVIDGVGEGASGKVFAWDGSVIPA